MKEQRTVLLDACAVVSLYACRRMAGIVAWESSNVAVAEEVAREAQFVFRGGSGSDSREREPVDLQPLFALGSLSLLRAENDDERMTYIDLSNEIGNGEAMTAAIAIHRDFIVVTDDKKAMRVLQHRNVHVRATLELIKGWADGANISPNELRQTLTDLRERGRYEPHRQHPLRGWWASALAHPD